ncbi:MAG TPA: DNA topoisomerase IV subunit A [Rhizobiales bacterium]|nr:DNA topoisomerase IV subunit A [Hyphomicrobiales bacterium]
MTTTPPPPSPDGIEPVNLHEALEERYLAYALATIMHRALPDARDGLKPVHRRVLYAMRQLKLDPSQKFKKCARVVGDVIGRYHPHGDQAVYDALVRLAQSFSVRYPLIDGQGNFGNIDGDNAAAMRYTESRLTDVAAALLEGLDEDTVDFRETYDGEDDEPVVLPANFPNLLANGSTGIAVGMATSIPPHNAGELCDAALHLIKFPNATPEKLCEFVKGPDFPTGGIIVEPHDAIVEAYRSGRGGFRVRAKWEREELGRGGYQIVISEIPYQVQKSKLIEKIAELMQARKLPLVADIRDESAEDIRLIIEPKSRTVDDVLMMESLFKLSDLENRISLNMNVLSAGQVPGVMSLREVLREWLDHRRQVLVRRSEYRLKKIDQRLEVVAGFLIAFLNLDEVIRIIRYEDEPKQQLMATFSLNDVQAEAILNMRLRSLRKLEEMELRREHEALTLERAGLKELLESQDNQWRHIAGEIRETRKKFGQNTGLGKRRSQFAQVPQGDFDISTAMIEKEPITIVCSQKGWIRALRGHLGDMDSLSFKTGDGPKYAFHAETTDKILMFASNGRFFTLGADKLPGGRGHGEPLRLMVDLDQSEEVMALFVHRPKRKLLVASSDGRGFVVSEDEVIANTRKGKQVLNVRLPAEALVCAHVPEDADHVAAVGENRKLVIFPLADLPEMARGRGVILQRYKDGGLSDAKAFRLESGLSWLDSSHRTWTVTELTDWLGARASAGRLPPKGFARNNRFGDVL